MTTIQNQIEAFPYNWPHDASLNSQTTALVVVDMQRDCMPVLSLLKRSDLLWIVTAPPVCSPGGYLEHQGYDISGVRQIIPGLQILLEACREARFPVYHTREGYCSRFCQSDMWF